MKKIAILVTLLGSIVVVCPTFAVGIYEAPPAPKTSIELSLRGAITSLSETGVFGEKSLSLLLSDGFKIDLRCSPSLIHTTLNYGLSFFDAKMRSLRTFDDVNACVTYLTEFEKSTKTSSVLVIERAGSQDSVSLL